MKSRLSILVIGVVGSLSTTIASGTPLLPDIIMDIQSIQQTTLTNGQKVIRFSTNTVNIGAGPLELHSTNAAPDGSSQDVYQWIKDSDGVSHTEHFAGTFAVVSGRLRFLDSADYFLKEITAGNGVGGIVAANQKVSYCIIDSFKYTTQPPGTPANAAYTSCGPTMGISVGWVDSYPYTFSTQTIPLAGVSDGTYWLENTGDPVGRLQESDETNNTTRVQVTINTTGLSPEIDVLGNNQSIPNNDTTPSSSDGTDFGSVDVATDSLTRTFAIQNTGTGSLSLTGVQRVQISGSSDFTVTTQPLSPVAAPATSPSPTPTTTTNFQIKFAPTAAGTRTATVTIINNDANEGSYQFAIQGNGVPDSDGDKEDDISEAASATDPNNPNSFVRTAKQLNISTRLDVQTGDNVGIAGFIINGAAQKTVLIRGLGPSLNGSVLSQILPDPFLELHDNTNALIASNNDWQDTQMTQIQNTGLAPGNLKEAAILRTLSPGTYTAIIKGNGTTNNTGVGLIEVYDVDPASTSFLGNISTRGFAGLDDSVMIGGEIVGRGLGANNSGSVKVLIRALGPSLPASIAGRLQDPMLELHDENGAIVDTNDDWKEHQSAVEATGLQPGDDRESAILAVLTKGNYTAVLLGKNNSSGVAQIEAYKVP